MISELLVNIMPSEIRVAYIIDDNILQEIHIEREAQRDIVGNIYRESQPSFAENASDVRRYRSG